MASAAVRTEAIPAIPSLSLPIEKQFETAQVFCPGGDCPGYVGMLVSKTTSRKTSKADGKLDSAITANQCTAFLIGEDLIMTNAHCLADQQWRAESSCRGTEILFPKTRSLLAERVRCQKVISASNLDGVFRDGRLQVPSFQGPDYAILKLERPVKRTNAELSFNGVPDEFSLKVYSANPVGVGYVMWSEIITHSCVSQFYSATVPQYDQLFYKNVAFTSCSFNHGNSGSPLVDAEGKVRAIAWSTSVTDKITINGRKINSRQSVASNLACIEFPTDVSSNSPARACTQGSDLSLNEKIDEMLARANTELVEKEVFRWAANTGAFFQWGVERVTGGVDSKGRPSNIATVTPWPRCIQDPVTWKSQPQIKRPYSPFSFGERVAIELSTPIWTMAADVDEKFKLIPSTRVAGQLQHQIEFSRDELVKNRKTKVRMVTTVEGVPQNQTTTELELEICRLQN